MIVDLIGQQVAVTDLCYKGNTPTSGEKKYISKALKRVVTIVHYFEKDNLYLTDFFMPEFIDDKNDFCYYGFLLLSRENFKICS